ncbi:peptidoglycan-binding protein [Streptomyces sp. NPDC052396]|uniref:peptidoglycan-binding protein n=1 Tax=Streptomyces sp. NPDC052396 TaxID=3365689 RepID=UPI0037D790F4
MKKTLRRGSVAMGAMLLAAMASTTSASAAPGINPIEIGDYGYGVRCVQAAVDYWGGTSRGVSVKVDGQFGNATENAVMEFQKDFGIAPDGVVGPQTGNYIVGYAEHWDPRCTGVVPTS